MPPSPDGSPPAPAVASAGGRLVLLLRVFVPFAAGYFLSYVFRSVNAAIAPRLISDLGLMPADLGLLASAYFLSFAGFQVPLGILLDRHGPRLVQALLLVLAAAGSVLFALATTREGLIAARLLIGLGVSACLMASFKAFVLWFPRDRLPLANGVVMAAGGLGALTATAPADLLADALGWRALFFGLAGLALAISLLVLLMVPQPPSPAPDAGQDAGSEPDAPPRAAGWGAALAGLGRVLTARPFRQIAPLAVASQATMLALQTLWAGPWLTDVAGLSPTAAASVLFWVAAAMVAGFLGLGSLAERLGRRGLSTARVATAGAVVFMAVQGGLLLQPATPGLVVGLWVAFGFFGTTGILFYASLSQSFPAGLAGRVNTAINLLVFIAAFAVQWGIGAVIEGSATPGLGFARAMGGLLAAQALALVWLVWSGRQGSDERSDRSQTDPTGPA